MVGERHGGLPGGDRGGHHVVDPVRPVEQAELAVQMEVYEVGHGPLEKVPGGLKNGDRSQLEWYQMGGGQGLARLPSTSHDPD